MKNEIIGYGSSFYTPSKETLDSLKHIEFLKNYILLYNGRDAISYVISFISKTKRIQTIWMPEYYCPYVKLWLEKKFDFIKYYNIDPFDKTKQPDWSQFNPDKDIVILNNYWGVRHYNLPTNKRPIVIEDHSHGWLTSSCMNSKADFCIASLRKTVPLPLGGIAWIPDGTETGQSLLSSGIFTEHSTTYSNMHKAWDILQKSMNLKAVCIDTSSKASYLNFFAQGEMMIRDNQYTYDVADDHKTALEKFSFKNYNDFKSNNLKCILLEIKKNKNFKIINLDEKDYFGLILVLKTKDSLNSLKQYLISNKIYPAQLWPENSVQKKYKYLLNIHVDFRYNCNDMKYIAKVINLWPNDNEI